MKRRLACLLCVLAFPAAAAAHVLDEYLQVAQIALAPGGVHVELRLIPGVLVAERVFGMIDVDHDGQISNLEEQAYARRVLQDIALEMDGRRTPLALTRVEFPSRREMNEGIGAIRIDLAVTASLGVEGDHQIFFHNDHQPELSVYLVNALVPTTHEIKISSQERDPLQREMRLSFQVTPLNTYRPWLWRGMLMFCLGVVLLFPLWKHRRVLASTTMNSFRNKTLDQESV
jgi:hypothetical protein